jgi:hypothetical protein
MRILIPLAKAEPCISHKSSGRSWGTKNSREMTAKLATNRSLGILVLQDKTIAPKAATTVMTPTSSKKSATSEKAVPAVGTRFEYTTSSNTAPKKTVIAHVYSPTTTKLSILARPSRNLPTTARQMETSCPAKCGDISRLQCPMWRRERDSNPRWSCPHNGFQDRRNRPLCHPSTVEGSLTSVISIAERACAVNHFWLLPAHSGGPGCRRHPHASIRAAPYSARMASLPLTASLHADGLPAHRHKNAPAQLIGSPRPQSPSSLAPQPNQRSVHPLRSGRTPPPAAEPTASA